MAASLVSRLGGSRQERETAYAELHAMAVATPPVATAAATAVACAAPLCKVLCMAVEHVGADEYQRACLLLAELIPSDTPRVSAETWMREQPGELPRFFRAWQARDSALGVVLAKDPAALTPEDARTYAYTYGWHAGVGNHPRGIDCLSKVWPDYAADFMSYVIDHLASNPAFQSPNTCFPL